MRLVTFLGLLTVLLVASTAAPGYERRPTVVTRAAISAVLPPRWHVVHRRLTPCVNPVERLVVRGNGALVMVQEGLKPDFRAPRFEPRPAHFTLRGTPSPLECCAPATRAGWLLNFRDHGRGFYVYVYPGRPGWRAQTLRTLNSLRVEPLPI
jgi:hypothetical protein